MVSKGVNPHQGGETQNWRGQKCNSFVYYYYFSIFAFYIFYRFFKGFFELTNYTNFITTN